MNPWVILAVVFALAGAYGLGHHDGYDRCKQEEAIAIEKKNQEMSDLKEKSDEEYKKVTNQLAIQQRQLRDAIHNGDQRLYVRVNTPTECSSSDNSTATAELDRETSESLIAITQDGDKAITDLNQCVKQYNEMREVVNGKR